MAQGWKGTRRGRKLGASAASPVPHELDGRHCWCGRSGCLETFLSESGFEDDYERITGERHDAASIAAAAATGDIVADSVVQVFEDRLGRATATIISLFDLQMIILGGMVPLPERLETRVPRNGQAMCRSIAQKPASQCPRMAPTPFSRARHC